MLRAHVATQFRFKIAALRRMSKARPTLAWLAATGQLEITNTGGGTLSFGATSADSWLSLGANSGTATSSVPALMNYTASATGLAAGTYRTSISLDANGGAQSATIPVTLAVSNSGQSVQVLPNTLDFTAAAQPAIQDLTVLNGGSITMPWTASSEALNGSWLSAIPTTGTSGIGASGAAAISIGAGAEKLAPGQYFGIVEVTPTAGGNSTQTVPVRLDSIDPSAAGALTIVPGTALLAGSGTATVTINNLGSNAATFTLQPQTTDGANWLSAQPASGTIPAMSSASVTLESNPSNLASGVRAGTLNLVFGDGTQRTTSAVMIVPNSVTTPCQPSMLVPVLMSLANPFQTTAGQTMTLQAVVSDDCGSPVTAGQLSASFDNGDPFLSFTPLAGSWLATWTPRAASTVNIVLCASSVSGGKTLSGTTQMAGTIQAVPAGAPAFAAASSTRLATCRPAKCLPVPGFLSLETA